MSSNSIDLDSERRCFNTRIKDYDCELHRDDNPASGLGQRKWK